ncbi:ParB N-terminal domain-containing protein [Kitasatospora sp. NPDC057223]|uniref:ParB N-terminal domain-containing protein n=1 Tax=Kitasatospora sp. NPDC057223 TaxID=3346055 RepID=UPI003640BE7C
MTGSVDTAPAPASPPGGSVLAPAADSVWEQLSRLLSPVEVVPVSLLLPADSPRARENPEHVRSLAASDAVFPPVIVHRATMRVIDGTHRIRASVLRGRKQVPVRFFRGTVQDAFVLAVEVNARHGLPLTPADRITAAERIVRSHPRWADRAVASTTGLSVAAVASIRRRATHPGEQVGPRQESRRPAPARRDCAAPRCGHGRSTGRPRGHGAVDGLRLCAAALDRLRTDLRGLRDAYRESEQTMAAGAPVNLRERVSGSRAATGIVLDEKVMAVRTELTEVLACWAGLVVEEQRAPGRGGPGVERDVPALVRFLVRHLEWLAAHPAAAEFDEEVARLLDSATRMFGPGPAQRRPVGTCPQPGCASTLHAVLRRADDHESPPGHVACEAGHFLPPQQWLLIAGRLQHCAPDAAGTASADRYPGAVER